MSWNHVCRRGFPSWIEDREVRRMSLSGGHLHLPQAQALAQVQGLQEDRPYLQLLRLPLQQKHDHPHPQPGLEAQADLLQKRTVNLPWTQPCSAANTCSQPFLQEQEPWWRVRGR